jgi:hypothetical protein
MIDSTVHPQDSQTLTTLRGMLLGVLFLGLLGLGVELLFLKHHESPAQVIAPGLIGIALLVLTWHVLQRGPASVRAIQATMVVFVAAAALGTYYHYVANVEFQREMDPSLQGMALFWKAMAAKAPPALAPGSMAQLGLIGLAYTFRHPAVSRHPPAARDAPPGGGPASGIDLEKEN